MAQGHGHVTGGAARGAEPPPTGLRRKRRHSTLATDPTEPAGDERELSDQDRVELDRRPWVRVAVTVGDGTRSDGRITLDFSETALERAPSIAVS